VLQSRWLPDDDGLMLVAVDSVRRFFIGQLWYVKYPGNTPEQVTHDLNGYTGLSMTADGKKLAAVQQEGMNTILVGPGNNIEAATPINTEKTDGINLVWTSDGNLIVQNGALKVFTEDANGNSRSEILPDAAVLNYCVCQNGLFLFQRLNADNRINIWRFDPKDNSTKQLTKGNDDEHPDCSPDSKNFIYQHAESGRQQLARMSIDGGEAKLFDRFTDDALQYSPSGAKIAIFTFEGEGANRQRKLFVLDATTGAAQQRFDANPDAVNLRWAPDGKALVFSVQRGAVANLWSQPLSGGVAKQITDFKADFIRGFSWSGDGKHFAIVRQKASSDVVLFSDLH
jgi:Tol biopolymer transport system component